LRRDLTARAVHEIRGQIESENCRVRLDPAARSRPGAKGFFEAARVPVERTIDVLCARGAKLFSGLSVDLLGALANRPQQFGEIAEWLVQSDGQVGQDFGQLHFVENPVKIPVIVARTRDRVKSSLRP